MHRGQIALALLALVVVSSIGPAQARHLSVGVENSGSLAAAANEPTISQEEYALGTQVDCHEPRGQIGVDPTIAALQADGFCGELIYHENSPTTTVVSARDQVLHGLIDRFDVVPVQRITGISTCVPVCPQDPGSEEAWSAVHDTGEPAGLTDASDEAHEQAPEDRHQQVGGRPQAPSATRPIQHGTGIEPWAMNGWLAPSATRGFVAQLESERSNGVLEPIGPDELAALTEHAIDSRRLAEDTRPVICGATADLDFTTTGTGTRCEVAFEYVPENPEPDTVPSFTGYDEACESPTYVCGSGGGFWTSQQACVGCSGYEPDQYVAWHWVVAPSPSRCGGATEPGFALSPEPRPWPFLAHDLDVYTPVTTADPADAPPADGVQPYAESLIDRARQQAGPLTQIPLPDSPPLPGSTGEELRENLTAVEDRARDTVIETTYQFSKPHRVEPNARPIRGLEDTSQTLTVPRDGDCGRLFGEDTPATVDPWQNVIDAEATPQGGGAGAYRNQADQQDEHNDPTTRSYRIEGKVGLFTDKDDDGRYGQAPSGQKYRDKHVREYGAYPMLWDVAIDGETGTIDGESGCIVDDEPFSSAVKAAGYGPNTGLATLVYLREPTLVQTSSLSDSTVLYEDGVNLLVLGTESVHHFWDADTIDPDSGPPLDRAVDHAIEALRGYAQAAHGEVPTLQTPGRELGLASDFKPQCDEPTGGFESRFSFTHECETSDCSGDTIVTTYTFSPTRQTGEIGGGPIPPFTPGEEPHAFDRRPDTWVDVDPFDGNPDRNLETRHHPPTDE